MSPEIFKESVGIIGPAMLEGGVKAPKSVEFWPELTHVRVGKLLRREARERFWKGRWRAV